MLHAIWTELICVFTWGAGIECIKRTFFYDQGKIAFPLASGPGLYIDGYQKTLGYDYEGGAEECDFTDMTFLQHFPCNWLSQEASSTAPKGHPISSHN